MQHPRTPGGRYRRGEDFAGERSRTISDIGPSKQRRSVALPTATRAKLSKLLTLLGSTNAVVRDGAALTAHRSVERSGLPWADVLTPPGAKELPEMGTWRRTVADCLQYAPTLRAWEVGFLRDLPGFQRLTVKQRYIIKGIAARVLGRIAA